MKKSVFKKITFWLVLIVFLLGAAQLYLSGCVSALSRQMGQEEERIEKLTEENQILGEKIAQESSLFLIEQKAEKLGFSSDTRLVDYSQEKPMAYNR